MPNLLKQIPETMRKLRIPEETLVQFNFKTNIPANDSAEELMALIAQMDELLTAEQKLAVMEQQGCCTTGKPAKAHGDFGKKHAGKSIAEKLDHFDELDSVHKPPVQLNEDGTLSAFWGPGEGGENQCVCGFVRKLPECTAVSPTFCGCCGGHVRKNLQRSLGVKLKLKQIVSSAASSGGKKRCEFVYEVREA